MPRPSPIILGALTLLGLAALFHARFTLVLSLGESMQPTLTQRQLLVVDRQAYRASAPPRGDLVVARHFGEYLIKRIVGLPGETIEVRQGRLWVNGCPVAESHPVAPGPLDIGAGSLSPDRYALLGDNRSLPPDQVIHAIVARDQILGRVIASCALPSPCPAGP